MDQNKTTSYIPALGYDFLTAYYDLAIKLTMPEKKFRRILIEEINPQDGESILEFGFGTGQNLILVKNQNQSIKLTGLDIDPKVKDIANYKLAKNNLTVPLDLYSGNIFPYPDNHFDKIYSCLVFHQLDAYTKTNCLKEIYRILKPGGELIIADWGKAENKIMRLAFGIVQMLDGFKTTNDNVNGKMPEYIASVGFENVKITQSLNTAIGTFSYFKAQKKFSDL
ncbi:MAG: class I SAM-dependent methyltransferase [Saprospiraceae bacterium]|nr:class I SAM-dependent methyltransferase [Saprospiraceae bacterium]